MTADENPVERAYPPTLDFTRKGGTRIPLPLATHTRRVVNRFGLFEFVWPIIVAYWTDSLFLDIWALFIATNGLRVMPTSFKRFPWTALMCSVYPLAFVISVVHYDPLNVWNWIPSRFSPVLLLQLVSCVWASYAIWCIIRCHVAHKRTSPVG